MNPTNNVSCCGGRLWKKDHDAHIKKRQKNEVDEAMANAIILGQCNETMKSQPGGMHGHVEVDKFVNVMALLNVILNVRCPSI